MPKVKLTEQEQKNRQLRAIIAAKMALYDVTPAWIAAKAHFAERTYYKRHNDPSTYRLEELRRISKALKFTDEEKALIL